MAVPPEQIGPLFDTVGVAGVVLTTSVVLPAGDVQPLTVTVTKYVPASVAVGFCAFEVKPFGPVHAYVAPATVGVDKLAVPPVHTGPSFDAVGVAGAGLTTSVVLPAADVQPFTVTVTK